MGIFDDSYPRWSGMGPKCRENVPNRLAEWTIEHQPCPGRWYLRPTQSDSGAASLLGAYFTKAYVHRPGIADK